jgi:hypothetical protein
VGVVISASRLTRIRLVTHYGISANDIDRALLAFERAMKSD